MGHSSVLSPLKPIVLKIRTRPVIARRFLISFLAVSGHAASPQTSQSEKVSLFSPHSYSDHGLRSLRASASRKGVVAVFPLVEVDGKVQIVNVAASFSHAQQAASSKKSTQSPTPCFGILALRTGRCPSSSIIRHPSSVIRHPSSIIHRPPFLPSSRKHHLPSQPAQEVRRCLELSSINGNRNGNDGNP